MPYIGKSPSAGVRQRYQYTATAGQTTFSGTDLGNLTLTYTDNNFLDCFQNGVLLKGGGTDYTATSGTSVVLTTGASVSDVIEIIVYDVFSVGNFYNRTDSDSRYALTTGATMSGALDLNGQELVLDADGDTSITADTDDQIDIKIAGTDVGTLTQNSGKLTVNSTGSNLSFAVGGTVELNTDGTQFYPQTDDSHNLGTSSLRFKDLYLSSGVFLGGTGAANELHDYEEGDRSSGSVTGVTASTNTVTGYYTKVGRQIVEHIKVVLSGVSGGSGNPYIGLSFTPTKSVGASLVQGGSIGMNTVITNSTFLNTGFMGVYGGNPQVYANDYQQGYYSYSNWTDGTLAFTVIYEAD
jgi:hypothetical protein